MQGSWFSASFSFPTCEMGVTAPPSGWHQGYVGREDMWWAVKGCPEASGMSTYRSRNQAVQTLTAKALCRREIPSKGN